MNRFHRFLPLLVIVGITWLVFVIDWLFPVNLIGFGVKSWQWSGLWGILFAPFLHLGWKHLLGNTISFLILGSLLSLEGSKRFWTVTLCAAVSSGLGAFILNPPGVTTVGASGVIFGYFGYFIGATIFTPPGDSRIYRAIISGLVIMVYGTAMFWGVLPTNSGVSWQGHLFGGLGGVLAAWGLARYSASKPSQDSAD